MCSSSRELSFDLLRFLPSKALPALLGFLTIPVLTRLLPSGEYARYVLALGCINLLTNVFIAWIPSSVLRFRTIHARDELVLITRRYVAVAAFVCMVVWAFAWSVVCREFDNGYVYLGAGSALVFGTAAFEYGVAWMRADDQAQAHGLYRSLQSLLTLLCSVVLVITFMRTGLFPLLSAMGATTILGMFALRWEMTQTRRGGFQCVGSDAMEILRYGIPVALANLLTFGLSVADRFILNSLLDKQAVAIYSASYDIGEKTIFFVNSWFTLSSSAVAFRLFDVEGAASASRFLSGVMRSYLVLVTPVVCALWVFADLVVGVVLPPEYAQGVHILRFVVVGAFLVGVMHRYTLVVSFHKRTDLMAVATGIALVVNVSACYWLIPKFALEGAALATFLGYLAWFVSVRIAASRYLTPSVPWPTVFNVTLALVAAATTAHGLLWGLAGSRPWAAGVAAVAFVLCYATVLAARKDSELRSMLKATKALVVGSAA